MLIVVDDLNDWVGVLNGHPQASTPAIDALAERGTLFTNAHAQATVCHSSRVSLLSGLLPTATGVYQNVSYREDRALRTLTLMPSYFAANGYRPIGAGKVFHDAGQEGRFSINGPNPGFGPFLNGAKKNYLPNYRVSAWDWGVPPYPESEMGDQKVADWTIAQLKALETDFPGNPFFFSVGFYRPHIPMYAPARFFDRFPVDDLVMPPRHPADLDDLPIAARDLTNRGVKIPHRLFTMNVRWRTAVQAYLASTAFVDHQIGRVLAALDKGPFGENTIVIVVSDHGFHLGEKEHWGKRTYWERSTHVPLLIAVPGRFSGVSTSKPVGLIDVFPTLLELCGLPALRSLQGHSLVPLMKAPTGSWTHAALTVLEPESYAVRSEHFRYIHYKDSSEELYDHRTDPNEWDNLAGHPAHRAVIDRHQRWAHESSHDEG